MSCLLKIVKEREAEWQESLNELEKANTLEQLLLLAYQLARLVALAVVEEVLRVRTAEGVPWPNCPQCGQRLESKGRKRRQLRTLIGVVKWKRQIGRCPQKCAIGQVAPLDIELGLAANQTTERQLQTQAILLALFVPFETASMLLEQLTGVSVSHMSIWNWVQASGERKMKELEKELAALVAGEEPEAEAMTAATREETLLMGADGVMVAFRPQAGTARGQTRWREVKVGILARLTQRKTRLGESLQRLHRHRVVAVLGSIDQLAMRMRLEALKQDWWGTPQVIWLSDGARGFWRLFAEQFAPHASGVLDFYHASQNLWLGIKGWLDGRTLAAKLYYRLARHRLRGGRAAEVLTDLEAALQLDGLPATAHDSLRKLYNYLDKHRDHIDYEALKQSGSPIGSGFVESTCKWLIQQRFKGVGMRWSEDGFNHLLHLRLAWVNGRFDDLFPPPPSLF